jgi:hypothetical protein
MNRDPLPLESDRRFVTVVSVVGVTAAVLNPVLYLLIQKGAADRLLFASLFALPVIWAVATVWLFETDRRPREPGLLETLAVSFAPFVVAVSAFMLLGQGYELSLRIAGSDPDPIPGIHMLIPVGAFACCGWPAGIACGVYLVVASVGRLWRAAKGGMTDGEDDTSAEGRP